MPSLEVRVAARIKLFSEIVNFVSEILREKGRVLERHVGSCNTHQIRELRDFERFSFWSNTGKTMFGGDEFKIWYQRGTEKVLVLHLNFQGRIEEGQTEAFDPKKDWLNALKLLIKNKKQVLARQEKERKLQEKKNQQQREREVAQKALRDKALRLGINV